MKITVDDETAAALERERAARGLRSRTEANREIVLAADKDRKRAASESTFVDRATAAAVRLAAKAKKGRAK